MTWAGVEQAPGAGAVPALLDLDDPRCADPVVAGGKAAWLARARAAGLPVLPGVVVSAPASRPHLDLGVDALARRGSGGARLEVSGKPLPESLAADLVSRTGRLGEVVVVRSSGVLEAGAEWSGAFTSYLDVAPADTPRAVVGCWASMFTVTTLARHEASGIAPGSTPMAILVQPALSPDYGGTARLEGSDVVVTAVAGSPAPLVQGWEPGVQARVLPGDRVRGQAALDLMSGTDLAAVGAALRAANAALGANTCEWAILDGQVHLLQLMLTRVSAAPSIELAGLDTPSADEIARLVRRYPGPLGEALVLPWAVAAPASLPTDVAPSDLDPLAALSTASEQAAALTAEVWGLPKAAAAGAAAHALRGLRGSEPVAALEAIRHLRAPVPDRAALILGCLARVRRALVDAGAVTWSSLGWYLAPDEARSILVGATTTKRQRFGFDRWEPFNAAVVAAQGRRADGAGAAPGIACGRMRWIGSADQMNAFRPREVIVAPNPTPNLAPLLWDAAGLVTLGGGPAAHLFESARALAIPAVATIHLDDLLGTPVATADGRFALTVDGTHGTVFASPW